MLEDHLFGRMGAEEPSTGATSTSVAGLVRYQLQGYPFFIGGNLWANYAGLADDHAGQTEQSIEILFGVHFFS
jgi:hypothetical protein